MDHDFVYSLIVVHKSLHDLKVYYIVIYVVEIILQDELIKVYIQLVDFDVDVNLIWEQENVAIY